LQPSFSTTFQDKKIIHLQFLFKNPFMKPLSVFFFLSILGIPIFSFSQTAYTFNGNGSWKLAANWLNNALPPTILPVGDSIIIDHAEPGECVLDTSQTISQGAKLVIRPGKNFTLSGNLTQLQPTEGTFTDSRDGQVYPYKLIGSQVWMTKNLNYNAPGSSCYNCAVLGRLYEWNTALSVAPEGWHIPSDAEWTTLTTYLGGDSVAGGKMKTTTLWDNPNTGATNSSGFSGLPAGHIYDGTYYNNPTTGYWWSSTAFTDFHAWIRVLQYDSDDAQRGAGMKVYASSVRCVRD
jgi:uncharacterized protein (TIGR02145 family)